MSDLRDEIARVLYPLFEEEWTPRGVAWEDAAPGERQTCLHAADAVLRMVRERLLADEAVEAGALSQCTGRDHDRADCPALPVYRRIARRGLSAAWRVVTGSNHE